jgi:hypothetical protein
LFVAPLWALIFLAILAGKLGDSYRLSVAAQPAQKLLSKAQDFVPTSTSLADCTSSLGCLKISKDPKRS